MLNNSFNKNFNANSLEFSKILESLLEVKAICLLVLISVLLYIFTSSSVDADYYYTILGLNALFFKGLYHQLLSSIFMHGSAEHLGMNMLALIAFGYRLERALGVVGFVLLYLLGGVLTSALSLSYLYFEPYSNLIGASGAVCVLLGFMAYFMPQLRSGLFIGLLIMSFAPMLLGVQVAWYAHIFGFGVGFGAGFLKASKG